MSQARIFVPQEALESWLTNGRAVLSADSLRFEGHTFQIEGAVHFLAEVADGSDAHSLVGRVKSETQLTALAAEHSHETVLLEDNAYQVVEGYILSPQSAGADDPYPEFLKLFAQP